jgi:hypothetical protein
VLALVLRGTHCHAAGVHHHAAVTRNRWQYRPMLTTTIQLTMNSAATLMKSRWQCRLMLLLLAAPQMRWIVACVFKQLQRERRKLVQVQVDHIR